MVFRAARHTINEGLLGGCVQEVVAHHKRQPPSLHQAGEDLADTRCQGNGAEVGRVGGVISCLLLAQQVHYANLPSCGDAWVVQQQLYKCSSAGRREGHLLMTV